MTSASHYDIECIVVAGKGDIQVLLDPLGLPVRSLGTGMISVALTE